MKVLFAHDHIFKESEGLFYSSGGLPRSVWERYTSVFGDLTVVGRDGGCIADSDKGFVLSSAGAVSFTLLPNIVNIKSFMFGSRAVRTKVRTLVEEHDALIARMPSRIAAMMIKEAVAQGKPYLVEVVGCPWDSLRTYGGWKAKIFAPYACVEMKFLLRRAKFALYVTSSFLQGRYPAAGIANVVACSDVEVSTVSDELIESRILRINERLPNDLVVFGLVGNYSSKYKGIDVAIKALAKSNARNWRLRILGGGDASTYLGLADHLGVSDKVEFVGRLPSGKAVQEWLDTVDIYLHPSLTEGMPRALIEAMSRGCPALASDAGGIPELLGPEEISRAGDVALLVDIINSLISDKDRQVSLVTRNHSVAQCYLKGELDSRRSRFFQEFKNSFSV